MAEGVAVRRLAAAAAVASLRPVRLPGARRAGDAGRRDLPGERGPAAQALDRGAAGPEPVGRRAVDVRRQRLVAPAAHGRRRRRDRLAAARRAGRRGARLADRPAAGGAARWRCWATRPRSRRSPPGVEQPNAGTSWARWVLGAPRRAGRRRRRRRARRRGAGRPRCRSWWPTAPPAALSAPALQAISAFVAARRDLRRLARARHRGGGRRRASRRPRSPPARRPSGCRARRSPWAAAWWSTTTTRWSPAATSWPAYGAVLSGWTLGLAGRAPGDPRRARRRRATPSSSPSTRSSAAPARAPRRCSRAR